MKKLTNFKNINQGDKIFYNVKGSHVNFTTTVYAVSEYIITLTPKSAPMFTVSIINGSYVINNKVRHDIELFNLTLIEFEQSVDEMKVL